MKLTEEAIEILSETRPAWVASANKHGQPNVSPRGSFRVLDDEHVYFADLASPRTTENLLENPQIALMVLDLTKGLGCRIWGRAEVLSEGGLFDSVNADLASRNRRANHVILVTVDDFVVMKGK